MYQNLRVIHREYRFSFCSLVESFVFVWSMGLDQMLSTDDSATNRSTEISETNSGTTATDSVVYQSPAQEGAADLNSFNSKASFPLLRPVGYSSPVTQLFDYIQKAWNYEKGDHCSYKYIPSRETHLEMTATVMIRLPDRATILVKDSKFRASRVLAQNAVAQLALNKLAEEDPELQETIDKLAKEAEERASMPPPPPAPTTRSYSYNYPRSSRYSPAAPQFSQGYYYPAPGGYYPSDHEMGGHPMMATEAMYYQAATPEMLMSAGMPYYGRTPPPPAPLVDPSLSAVSNTSNDEQQQNSSGENNFASPYPSSCPIMTPTGQWYAGAGASPSSPHQFHPSYHWQYMQPPASPMGGYYPGQYAYAQMHPPTMVTGKSDPGERDLTDH